MTTSAPPKVGLRAPIRTNCAGGWSDQLDWRGTKAVVNAAFGWHAGGDDPYPLRYDGEGFHSRVEGIGTGLGISSIRAGLEYLYNHPNDKDDRYIQHVLAWEIENGTKGGWQDQVGAIAPGFKLIETSNHVDFKITNRDNHPVINHILLFDSGIRRLSKMIGDKVRDLFATSPDFCQALEQNVLEGIDTFWGNAETAARAYIAGWQRLVHFVPEMAPANLPYVSALDRLEDTWGWMHVGAGGGGWGMVFVSNPKAKPSVIHQLKKAGIWAKEPVLLPGLQSF